MKFTIKKKNILDTLSKVQGLTGRKSNLAITSNLLIKTADSGISISATDLETGFEGNFPAIVESEGVIAIHARKLFEIIRDFPSEDIQINEIERQWIEIGNQNVEYHIVGMNSEDFPELPHIEDIDFFEIDSSAFKQMIDKTVIIGAPREEKRAHIIGINFERIDKEDQQIIRMVSTDARRLSKVDYVCDETRNPPSVGNVIIPKNGLNEVNKFIVSDGVIQLGIKNNYFIVKKENEMITVALLEGEFPDYRDIIVTEEEDSIELDKHYFTMMLKRMSILSSEDYKSVIFNFGNGKLVVTATNPEIGESREDMEIEYSRDPIEVAFNPKYFIETLNAIADEKILLYIKDGQNPCLIEGITDKSFLSVIMPMKI
jgi:DNA polymerase-3 subunit beta